MPWNEIKLNISANMDFGDAKQQISTIKQGIDGLKTSISEMPNVSKILDNSFERSATVVDALNDKLDRLEHKRYSSDEERLALERGANNNVLELNALRDVQFGTTSYSAQVAKQWFGNLPSAIQHQFDTMAPQLTAIIRSRMSSLSKAGEAPLTKTAGQIAKELTGGSNPTKMDPAIRSLLNKHSLSNTDAEFNLDKMIEYLIPSVTAANMNKEYQKARYGSIRRSASAGLYTGKPEDLFPESFKTTFRSQGKDFQIFDKSYQQMVLNSAYRKQLDSILKSNPVAVKAAIASGISRRDERGVLETKDEISRSEWEGFRQALYDDLLVRVSGYKGNAIDAYKATGKDKRTLMQRLTSSTSGRAMLAMQDIEGMEDTRAWTNAANPGTWSKLHGEGKRIQDQLVVSKYSPFTGDKAVLGDPRSVMISESHNTRLLGGGKWKNNQDVSDTIRIVSLAGYDAKNPEHQKFLENLFNPNGAQLGDAKFIAQSIHGTGQDTIVRMIEQGAYNRVNEQEADWIKNHPDEAVRGIRGTYWRGFDDAEIDRLIQNGVGGKNGISAQKYGKHLEMLNKPWTNTTELGINIDGKRFAVVDTSRLKDQLGGVSPGDGGAFFASSVMPHSGQFRGGVGLKGSAFVFEGNDLKAFGKKTGLLDEQGRLMMPGPNGELYDISGYQGYIPLDVIKNQGVLKDENGNYVSGDVASRRLTALLQRHPMSYHADYDLDQVASDNLGTQMSSFMMFSPKLRQHQIDMAMRRMQELDTEEGQLKYVFGNKDDYLSRKVNPEFGGNSQLLATTEARSRIDNMRASIFNDLIAGKYINFEGDDKIANLRAAASPLATLVLSKDGTIPDATIARARSYLDKEANARLSDQDIRDMIVLPEGKVLDFNRKDQANVAVVRSPTGYGNMYYAQNLAADAEPIYRGFGISTSTGMYVSEKDRRVLQGMDYDADQVKAIYDKELASAVQASLSKMGKYKDSDVKAEDIVYTPEQLKSWSIQNRLQAERSLYATMPMGTGSSGIRIMQVDYSRPENQALVYAAQRMAGIYDIGSTPKKAQTYTLEKDDPVWAALGLGKEYTKFSEKRTDLFKFDEGMIVSPDHKNAVKTREGTYIDSSHPDVYKASNGEYINLRALRDMGIDEINLPSRYMANHMMGIAEANRLYRTGNVDPTQMDAIYEAMNTQLGYGDAGPERIKLMQTIRMLHHQFGTGERAYISNDEGQYIQSLIDAASAELTLSANKYQDPNTGKFMLGDKAYDTKEQWAKAQEAKYGIRTARNAIDQFGMLESDLVRTFGDDFKANFVNVTDTVGQTLVSKVAELRQQAEQYKESEQPKESATTVVANDKMVKDESGNIVYEDKDTGKLVYVKNPKATGSSNMPIAGVVSTTQSESADAIWGPQTFQKTEDQQKKNKVLRDLKNYEHALEINNKFNQIMSDTRAYSDELWKDQRGKENKLNDEKTLAERQYNYLQYRTFEQLQPLNELEKELEADTAFTGDKDLEAQRSSWMTEIAQVRNKVTENMHKSFTNGIMLDAKRLEDDLTKEVNGFGLSKQKETLNKYDERISQQQKGIAWMQDRLDRGLVDKTYQKQYEDAIKTANKNIASAQQARANLAAEYTTQNETAGKLALESLQIKQGFKNKNSLSVISAARKQEISALRKQVGNQYNEGQFSKEEYERINKGLDQLDKRANPAIIALGRGAKVLKTELKSTSGYLTNMFTRRLFQSAISETTNFVKQFDASMNTIQMITLKTNEQISTLGDTLIGKAKEMKVSVSEITQSAATLYRQGLSDQEVDERLGVISKFSKVSGTKVDAATKLITVAMNTGLVDNAEQAADIVTALGDNAATNAAEIEKGIEKAGAAAAADGTTFAELASMLTAITSTTQIGGNVAGRTLNTIFGRMNKIGTNELIYDENGHAVSGSAVAKLLAAQGVRTYDEQGNKRSSFDVLYDLSQKWDSLNDATQQQLATQIAGTRQYSNFAAIMQGMAEGKVDEYMKLASESEGITDKKYDIYLESLQASLTDLKNTFDGLIHDLTSSGVLTGAIKGITSIIEGVDNLTGSVGGLGAILSTVLPMLIGLAMFKAGMSSGSIGPILAGLGIAAVGGMIASNNANQTSDTERYQNSLNRINNNYNATTDKIERSKLLRDKGDGRTSEETQEYTKLISELAKMFNLSDPTKSVDEFARSLDSVSAAAQNAAKHSKEYAEVIDKSDEEKEKDRIRRLAAESGKWASGAAGELAEIRASQNKSSVIDSEYLKDFFDLDEEGNIVLDDYQKFLDVMMLGFSKDADANGVTKAIGGALNNWESVPGLGAFIDWASPGLRKLVGKNADEMEYSFTNNRPRLAKLMEDAMNTISTSPEYRDLFNQLVEEGYSGWDYDNWFNYLGDIHAGKSVSLLPIQMLQSAMRSWGNVNTVEQTSKEKIISDFKTQIQDFAPWMDQERIDAIAEKAAVDVRDLENNGYNTSLAYSTVLGNIFNLQSGNYGRTEIEAAANAYATGKAVPKNLESQYTLEKVNESGYYIDLNKQPGEEGYYVSKEEAEKRVKAYNESLEPIAKTETRKIQHRDIMFGDETFASFDVGDTAAVGEANKKYIEAVEKIKATQKYLKEVSEDQTSAFQNLSLEDKETFATGEIQKVFKELGLNYTGDIAHFLTTRAEDMFSVASDVIEKEETTYETNPTETPKLKAIQDYALGERTTSYSKWSQDEKTAYKLVADRVYRAMQESGATDINTWLNYVNDNGLRDFETLYQNGEFGKLMKQVYKNPETGMYEAPADMMDQIMRFVLSNGTLGEGFISNKQKADYAQSMYDTLLSGEMAFLSTEEAEQKEKEERAKYEAEIKRRVEEARAQYGEQFTEEDYKNLEAGLRNTPYTGFIAEGARVYTPDEQKYLQEIVGEELYDRLTGRSGIQATAEEQAYAAQLISNKRVGLTALTDHQKYNWLQVNKDRLSTLGQEGGMSRTVADAYMSQWNGWSEYAALLEKRNTEEGLSTDEQKLFNILSQSLENFEKEAKIKINIEGVSTLEEANKVLEGTTNLIKNLQKGGEIAIKARLDFESNLFNTQQQQALLDNGSYAEQLDVISSVSGLSKTQIQAMGFEEAKRYTQNILTNRRNITAESLNQIYDSGNIEHAEELARRYGYENAGGHQTIDEILNFYNDSDKDNTYQYDYDTGKLFKINKATGESEEASQTLQKDFNKRRAGYTVKLDANGNPVYEDLAYGSEAARTAVDIARNRQKLIAGTLKYSDTNRRAEYQEAYEALGQEGKNYLAMLDENRRAEEAKTESVYSQEQLDAQKAKADAENAIAMQEAEDQYVLEQARLNATTVGGAYAYAQLQYQQSNKAGFAANAIYQGLTSAKVENVEDLAEAVNGQDVQNWKDLLESSDDVRKAFEEVGAKVDQNGNIDLSDVEKSGYDAASALEVLTQAVAGASEAYNKRKEVLSEGETYDRAMDYLQGKGEEEAGYEAYAEITGNSRLADIVRNNRLDNEEYYKYSRLSGQEKKEYRQEHGGRAPDHHADIYEGLTDYERNYAKQLEQNAALGISGLTADQRNEGAMEILKAAQEGPEALQALRQGGKIGAFDDYLSGIENVDQIFADLASGDPDKAAKALKNFNEQLDERKAKAATRYSKGAENMATILSKIKKGGKDASEGMAMLRKNFDQYQDQMSAVSKASGKSGKNLDNQTREILASMFDNISADDIKNMTEEQLSNLLDGSVDSINEGFADSLQSMLDNASVDIDVSGIDVNADGEISLEELEAAYRAAGETAVADALAMAGHYADIDFKVDQEGQHISVDAIVTAASKYNQRKGGGGGGGKSAADKLLEKQKHDMAALEHESKMLSIQEKTFDYKNDFGGLANNLQAQIDLQKQLQSAYEKNIAEMEEMLKKTKQGTDDWYKLRDAIFAAKEALAESINTENEIKTRELLAPIEGTFEEPYKYIAHGQSLLDQYAQRAMTEDKFGEYMTYTQQNMDFIQNQKAHNDQYIGQLKDALGKADEGTDTWYAIRDEIWAKEVENAELDNKLAQMRIDLYNQRLAQSAKVLQYNNQTAEHNKTLASSYGSYYQEGGYRNQYASMLLAQIGFNNSEMGNYAKAKENAKAVMDELESAGQKGTSVWFDAEAALYQADEGMQQLTLDTLELKRALAESDIEAITEKFSDLGRETSHVGELLKTQMSKYLENGDYEAYYAASDRYLETLNGNMSEADIKNLRNKKTKRDRLRKDLMSGRLTGKERADALRELERLDKDIAETEETKTPGLIRLKEDELAEKKEKLEKGIKDGTLDPATQRNLMDDINQIEADLIGLRNEEDEIKKEKNKAKIDEASTKQAWQASNYQHNMQMLNYDISKYQNNGELTNVITGLTIQNELREKRKQQLDDEIAEWETLKESTEAGSEEEKKCTEEIMKRVEERKKEETEIEKNNKAIEETKKKLVEIRKTLQDSIDKEIEAEKKHQREMLSATVSTQDSILNVLRERYKYEQDLRRKDLEKEKESLNEYKKLINERFNYRKKAADQANKAEDIAELKRQLAIIEADPTRTKDAKELRRKIKEAEEEEAWTIAEGELEAENERTDEQIEGIDKLITFNEEKTNEYLKNANNFAEEVKKIYEGTYDDLVDFMYKTNESFIDMLPDAQKQFLQGLNDTWKTAKDIRDNNFKEIAKELGIYNTDGSVKSYEELSTGDYKERYLNYMRSHDIDYIDAINNGDITTATSYENKWIDIWDNFLNSIKDDATFDEKYYDLGQIESDVSDLLDEVFQIKNLMPDTDTDVSPNFSSDNTQYTDLSQGVGLIIEDLSGIHKAVDDSADTLDDISETLGSGDTPASKNKNKKYYIYVGSGYLETIEASSEEDAIEKASKKHGYDEDTPIIAVEKKDDKTKDKDKDQTSNPTADLATGVTSIFGALTSIFDGVKDLLGFSEGGLVNYTGLAKVHGSPSKPESFLDATDTALLRSMLDSYNNIKYTPNMSYVDPSMYRGDTNVGDINITINQAELKSDADIDKLAKQVGQAFTKQLQREGLNLSGYAF